MAIHASPVDFEDDDDDDGGFQFAPTAASRTSSRPIENVGNHNHPVRSNLPVHSVRHNRSPSPASGRNIVDNHDESVRSTSTGRSSIDPHTVAFSATKRSTIKTLNVIPPIELMKSNLKEQRVMPALEQFNKNYQEDHHDASALYDELELIKEENERIIESLRHAELKRDEAEARARELEKQVANIGEGAPFDKKYLLRKEQDLRLREQSLKAEKQKRGHKDVEFATLRAELESLKQETARTIDNLQEAESEAKALRTMTQRMTLTHEEMEEVVLKRCWLARYWGLAVQYGICEDIAVSKYEMWSAFAPLPFEVVVSAGQKAKDDFLSEKLPDENKSGRDPSNLTAEGNIESMLSVEMGLRELASLKIEDAVLIAMAQLRRQNSVKFPKSPAQPKFSETFDLHQEESDDVLFKQAWLTYFWNRARYHGVEDDIAAEKLQYWISRSGCSATSHDAVDVERGLRELRKLGIEQQLWQASRREI
nr:coiled-coil domain-containing protein SCD2 [Fagopyrum tataricum]